MNYYNPYLGLYSASTIPARTGLLRGLFSGRNFSFGSIISGVQKTLNLVNQTIPVIKQVSPVMKNAKTMFKVMNEFKKTDTPKKSVPKNNVSSNASETTNNESNYENIETIDNNENGPTFFI